MRACIALGHYSSLQPALLYSQFGFGIDNTRSFAPGVNSTIYQVDEHYRFHYLTLTPQVVYHLRPTGQGWQIPGAPYSAFLLGGNYSANYQHEWASGAGLVQVSDGRIERGSRNTGYGYATTYYMPSFDAGFKGGIGYRFSSVLLQASYSLGLVNLGSDYNSVLQRTDYYNRAIHFSLAYLFSPKS